ncbi:MAG: small metal-binding protein SmbP [Methylococcales bacterium]|nr:small metal-binding protein SmbP [Methylococcales bacterium]
MKKLTSVFAVLLLVLSFGVFAEEHLDQALEHANAAVVEGQAGKEDSLVVHAKAALEHSLAASLVAKSVPKGHIDAASKSLQDAIDHGNLGPAHVEMATKSAEEAVEHLKAAKSK